MTAQLLIYCCPLSAVDDELRRSYETLLSAEERQRFDGFRVEPARQSFVVSRALLRTVLAQQLGCAPQDLSFARDHNDKPYTANPNSQWRFNLSHSGDWAVLALSSGGEVGIDVEYHERRNQLDGISKRFFAPNEHRWLSTLPEELRRQRFFELWTLKEAYVKALGRGIATALAGTDIEYLNDSEISLALSGAACCEGSVRCWHYPLAPAYSLALSVITADEAAIAEPQLFHCIPFRECRADAALRPSLTGAGHLA